MDKPLPSELFEIRKLVFRKKAEAALPRLLALGNKYDEFASYIHCWIGECHYLLGNISAACASFAQAVELNGADKYSLWRLGSIFQEAGNPEKSNDYYSRILAIDPHHVKAQRGIDSNRLLLRQEAFLRSMLCQQSDIAPPVRRTLPPVPNPVLSAEFAKNIQTEAHQPDPEVPAGYVAMDRVDITLTCGERSHTVGFMLPASDKKVTIRIGELKIDI